MVRYGEVRFLTLLIKPNNFNKMELDIYGLERILPRVVECGIAGFCKRNGIVTKDEISQRQAFKSYGEPKIRDWEKQKKIKSFCRGTGKNSKIMYSRSQIELQIEIETNYSIIR